MGRDVKLRTRVKICGITRIEDAKSAISSGCDALGFVFYERSPRAVSVKQAADIIAQLPPFVSTVALFVDATPEFVRNVIQKTGIDLLQFHGHEKDQECVVYNRPFIKALRMRPEVDLKAEVNAYPNARAILLDAYTPGIPGGTGEQFDWSRIPLELSSQIILAGGLDATNVAQAISQVKPYAVDVSGGVEGSKGIKDAVKIQQFITEVYRVNDY